MPLLDYKAAEKQLGIRFKRKSILKLALSHASYRQGKKELTSNERLEFLGDAVLELVVREFLLGKMPEASEGKLSETKKAYTCTDILYKTGKKLRLGKFIIMDKGEIKTGGRKRPSNIADCLEAIIGALYLDRGLPYTRRFIKRILLQTRRPKHKDYKSLLNHWIMLNQSKIEYKTTSEQGPAHCREFYIDLYIDRKKVSHGKGKTKKQAEQDAARLFLKKKRIP